MNGGLIYINILAKKLKSSCYIALMLIFIFNLFGCATAPSEFTQATKIDSSTQNVQTTNHSVQDDVKTIPAQVIKGIDGDTIKVSLNGKEENIRFIGANAPELSHPDLHIQEQPYGKEAAKYTTNALIGKTVYLEFDVGQRDKYGRLLAYIWLDQPKNNSETEIRSKMFNAQLLLEGYAQVMTVQPNVKYQSLFVNFEREARNNNRGFWGISGVKPNDRYGK